MSDEIFTQYEIAQKWPEGEARRIVWLDASELTRWLKAGWAVLAHYQNIRVVKDSEGHLVEVRP